MSQTPDSEQYPKTFFWGALLGMVVGVILAIWYAPQSGDRTRHQLGQWMNTTAQGESIEQALAEGRALAHEHRASRASS